MVFTFCNLVIYLLGYEFTNFSITGWYTFKLLYVDYFQIIIYTKRAIDYMLSTGVFTLTESPMQRRIRKSIESAERIAADIRKNGSAGYQTLDELLDELRAEK